ncbi:MAG TPA: VOC family protein, partial [Microthrixaceae bacterium]|nr:VOC family protein [Microthrixaceae bacterium]
MTTIEPLLISLPIADRKRAHAFYRDALGLEPVGELADDGVPEPLMFVLNSSTRMMLVPSDGFGWVIGDHTVAPSGTSECVLGISAASEAEVEAIVERARAAGAVIATEPAPQPWGYASAFSDLD